MGILRIWEAQTQMPRKISTFCDCKLTYLYTVVQGFNLFTLMKNWKFVGRTCRCSLQGRLAVADLLARYQCAASLQISPPKNLSLERMVLNPTRQDPGTYAMCRPLQPQLMPFNEVMCPVDLWRWSYNGTMGYYALHAGPTSNWRYKYDIIHNLVGV